MHVFDPKNEILLSLFYTAIYNASCIMHKRIANFKLKMKTKMF